ncbi:tetratricopeptide repeat protein (macronuclear) [Tetrahymena thermophila SB210]|uniref:Tetratricopeptide repeat protein n=1 Tax=Tetrahymena thermophila (strain SB210) TaxID=312017 RepID=W7XIV3_TETTS|nr:tetratricopeptide repeat protein [Tetrahymena thermophila SB210]EWS73634.1 tetratricopeptide repeat protein [Tetrahymena thermophila SB210]|eukprot:XP_012653864.1 tetratricopeptide repeat protein [Tetrahymena thermophila SB210]
MMLKRRKLFQSQIYCFTSLQNLQEYFQKGNYFFQKKMYQQAIEQYNCCLKINPEHVMSIQNIGLAQFQQNELDKSIQSFQRVLQIQPKSDQALYHLGICYLYNNQLESSFNVFQKCTQYCPKNEVYFYYLGLSCLRMNLFNQAQQYFLHSLDISPTNQEVLYCLGLAYHLQGQKKQTLSVYEKLLSLDSKNLNYRNILCGLKAMN